MCVSVLLVLGERTKELIDSAKQKLWFFDYLGKFLIRMAISSVSQTHLLISKHIKVYRLISLRISLFFL